MEKELTEYDRKLRKEAFDVVRGLSNYVNNMSHNPDFLIEAMSREHRTLQQSMTNVVLRWLVHLSKLGEYQFDLRNAASVGIAKQIVKSVPEIEYRLPLI